MLAEGNKTGKKQLEGTEAGIKNKATKHSETLSLFAKSSVFKRGTFARLHFYSEGTWFAKKITAGPTEPVNFIAFLCIFPGSTPSCKE